jgi:hypothetical protein
LDEFILKLDKEISSW